MSKIYGIGDEEELANDLQEEMSKMIPLSVIDEIKAEIDALSDNEYFSNLWMIDVKSIIDSKVKEYNTSNVRECNTCKHSNNGETNSTETCHECMWDSKYEKVKEYTE